MCHRAHPVAGRACRRHALGWLQVRPHDPASKPQEAGARREEQVRSRDRSFCGRMADRLPWQPTL